MFINIKQGMKRIQKAKAMFAIELLKAEADM